MGYNRPWNIWWDFVWHDGAIRWVVVQTDHPKYKHVDYIYRFPLDEIASPDGTIEEWVDGWFRPFVDDLYAGRESLHEVMKYARYTKEIEDE